MLFIQKKIATYLYYESTFVFLQKQKYFHNLNEMDEFIKLGYLAGATRFRRISDKLYIEGNKLYSNANVPFKASWFSVYYALAISGKPLAVSDLANIIGFSHITVKNIVREMEQENLVVIELNTEDKRSKLIRLSEYGLSRLPDLKELWKQFTMALQTILKEGHPDILNILARIDKKIESYPVCDAKHEIPVHVLDYTPSLKGSFTTLVGEWLSGMLHGKLEKEDLFTINNPGEAYLLNGGFVLFAEYNNDIVGCVALKRLDDDKFEVAKLIVKEDARRLGIATKLIERCVTRCHENKASELWLQTTNELIGAHKLYYKMGFTDKAAPASMSVLKRTKKIMMLKLN